VPDEEVTVVTRAYEAVGRLRGMLADDISPEFDKWFRDEYGMAADLESPLGDPSALTSRLTRPLLRGTAIRA